MKNSYNLRAYSGRDVCVCNSQIKTCYVASMKPSPLKLLSNFQLFYFHEECSKYEPTAHIISWQEMFLNMQRSQITRMRFWRQKNHGLVYHLRHYIKLYRLETLIFFKLCDRVPKLVTCNHIYLSAKIYPLKFTS